MNKRHHNVPSSTVISNCGTPTEKASEFLDHHLKHLMHLAKSYVNDTSEFLRKINEV